MSRNPTLRQKTINQFIDCLEKNILTFPLPALITLADMFNVSRTTMRAVLAHLLSTGVLQQNGEQFCLQRKPTGQDKVNCIFEERFVQDQKFEHYFYHLINSHKLLPGDRFDEIQIAKDAKVSPIVVREFLLRFLHYGLINHYEKGKWELVIVGKDYAEKLYEFRSILEIFALRSFMAQTETHINWTKAKELLQKHKNLQQSIQTDFLLFSGLDRDFHQLILSSNNNPFFVQSFDLISVIFHFHYQWENSDLKQRNSVAVSEHIAVLSAMLQKDETKAIAALCKHLNTAKISMRESIDRSLKIKDR
ncbi:GntR family transcriptional regulator [Orbus hercynius]|uniref:GntR family transcriptional regulator n=1 Tax=Orbus hercynius TaxID=593135 RepID=A0A495RE08_9GAMM|nr:GntR family transcriptional regulator [Orbus hercynius]RKS85713.1 GntR family transcriptional regulator [Orbus hercynius]